MKKGKKTEEIKIRLSPKEKLQIKDLADQENMDVSSYIRSKLLSSPKKAKKPQITSGFDRKQVEEGKVIAGRICSLTNQIKVGVDVQGAVLELEREVKSLCRILG